MRIPIKPSASLLGAVLLAAAGASANGAAAQRTPDEIRAEIGKLQQRIETLEKEAHQAEEVQERKREFDEIREESARRLAEYAEQIKGLQAEEPEGDIENQRVNARLSHLNKCKGLDQQIQALKDHASLAEARRLRDEIEVAHTEWDLVAAPVFDMKSDLAQMTEAAREHNRPGLLALLEEARAAHQKHVENCRKEFEAWKAGRESGQAVDRAVEKFWRAIDALDAAAH